MAREESSGRSTGLPTAAIAIWLAVLAFVAFGNTLRGEFVWDDASSILLHQHVKDPSKVFALFTEDQHAFAGGAGNFYRPLLSVTFLVDYALARIGQPAIPLDQVPTDLSPTLFHVSSILWHAAAAIALFLFMRRTGAPEVVCLAVSTIFVVHPLHTEAVAYISGRADSMAAAFMFAALYFCTWDETSKRRSAGVALALVAYGAALLSKESAFIFPVLLVLTVGFVPRNRVAQLTPGARWLPLALSAGLLALYGVLRRTVLDFGGDAPSTAPDLGVRVIETLQSFALYMKLLFVPTHLHMERTLAGVPGYTTALGVALLIAIAALAVWCSRTGRRRATFGFAWFIATWLPISGLFPLNAPMAEHWLYVPMAGFWWGVAEIVYSVVSGHRAAAWIVSAVLVSWLTVLVALTAARNLDWRNNKSLYIATLRENPESIRVQFNLGVVYQDLLDNPAGARRHFENVVAAYTRRKAADASLTGQFWADELESYLSLGDIHLDSGRYDRAIPVYQTLLSVQATDQNRAIMGRAAFGLGRCYLAIGEYEAAISTFRRAAELVPGLAAETQRTILREAPLAAFTLAPSAPPNQ